MGHADEAADKKLFSSMLKKALPNKKSEKAVVKPMKSIKAGRGR